MKEIDQIIEDELFSFISNRDEYGNIIITDFTDNFYNELFKELPKQEIEYIRREIRNIVKSGINVQNLSISEEENEIAVMFEIKKNEITQKVLELIDYEKTKKKIKYRKILTNESFDTFIAKIYGYYQELDRYYDISKIKINYLDLSHFISNITGKELSPIETELLNICTRLIEEKQEIDYYIFYKLITKVYNDILFYKSLSNTNIKDYETYLSKKVEEGKQESLLVMGEISDRYIKWDISKKNK